MKKVAIILSLALLLFAGCKKPNKNNGTVASKGVYITNEGNFTNGNAEISFYDPATEETTNNLFYAANGYKLGDVGQSMYIKDSTGFIVVNNSQKIVVVKIPSLVALRTITIPNSSPRYFLPVNDSIAYVTELYNGQVDVVNYQTGNLVTEITGFAKWTEHMIASGNLVIVEERNLDANPAGTCSIATINTVGNTFGHRYSFTGSNVNGIAQDNMGRIWMAVDTLLDTTASLICLNTDFSTNKSIKFISGHHPWNLHINGTGDVLYFFDTDIYSVSINNTSAPTSPFALANGSKFYGLNVDPYNGDVYASDAHDYIQASTIYRYDKNANVIQSFNAGINSGNFIFNNE
jgi:hypothetical protein